MWGKTQPLLCDHNQIKFEQIRILQLYNPNVLQSFHFVLILTKIPLKSHWLWN